MNGKSAWISSSVPRSHKVQQGLHREAVSADARLTAHLAWLDRDAVQALHAVQCTAGSPECREVDSGRRRVRFLWCAMRVAPAFWCYLNWRPDLS